MIQGFPSDTSVVIGEKVLFSVAVSGDPEPAISWYHNGKPIDSDKIVVVHPYNCLSINSVEHEDGGVYKMYATNSEGSAINAFKLKVRKRHSEKDLNRIQSFRERDEKMAAENYEMHMMELHHGLPDHKLPEIGPKTDDSLETINIDNNHGFSETTTINGNHGTSNINVKHGHTDTPTVVIDHRFSEIQAINGNHGYPEIPGIDDNHEIPTINNNHGNPEIPSIDDNHKSPTNSNHSNLEIPGNHEIPTINSNHDNLKIPANPTNDKLEIISISDTNLEELNKELATNIHPV